MNLANTSFMILASILVLFMTPGLAFFMGALFQSEMWSTRCYQFL